MSEPRRCCWCFSQCTREINAGTREQMEKCRLEETTLVSVSTLMDKQTRFLLRYVKNGHLKRPKLHQPHWICSTTSEEVSVDHQRGPASSPRLLMFMEDSLLKKAPREILFLASCANVH